MAAANNASFQFLFPRTLLLFEVPRFLFVLWRMRPPPQDRLERVVLGLTAALSLLGWVTGEALWYWESADLSLRWSDGPSAAYCRSLMSHLRRWITSTPAASSRCCPSRAGGRTPG